MQRDRARSDDLDAARLLAEVAAVVLDEQVPAAELRAAVFERVGGRELVRQAATTVHELVPGDGSDVGKLLMRRYPAVRRYLPALVRTVPFAAATPDHPVLAALSHLRAVDEGRAVIAGAPRRW